MTGFRTITGMTVAVLVGLYQYYVGPLPEISPEAWGVIVPLAALGFRFITTGPVGSLRRLFRKEPQ